MVQSSAELSAVFTRLLRAFQEGDEEAVRRLMSSGEHTLILGTDPREWLGGGGVELILVQMRGIPEFHYELRRSEGFEHDGVGWVAADVTSHVLRGPSVDLRMSATFTLEEAGWRLVHLHTSSPSPDDADRIGPELSATMQDILDSLEAESETRALRQILVSEAVKGLVSESGDIVFDAPLTFELQGRGRLDVRWRSAPVGRGLARAARRAVGALGANGPSAM